MLFRSNKCNKTNITWDKHKIETVLINSNFTCGYYIDRNKLYHILKFTYGINSAYDPCSYPGIQCEFYYNVNSKIQTLMKKTRDKIKLRGSIVNEITTRGDFIKKIRDSVNINQNNQYRLEVVSLKDSKTADPIIVELNITQL